MAETPTPDVAFDSCGEPDCDIPKPILQLDNGYGVTLCRPTGPITLHFQIPAALDDCPPEAPSDPVIVGWTDDLTGAFTAATSAPADAVPCGEKRDFESVRWCALDADGDPIGDVLVEYEYDEETGALAGSKVLNPDGTAYSGPAYDSIGRCNDVPLEYTTNTECRDDTFHVITRSIDRDGVIVELEAVDTGLACHADQISEVDVCVDGCAAIRRTIVAADGTETVTFIGEDGADITADATAAGWLPGACPGRDTWDTCFAPEPTAIVWAWNIDGDLMSYDPITGEWTDYGKTTLADGTVVGGYAMTVENTTNGATIYYWFRDCLYKSDPDDPVNTFALVGCDRSATNFVPCMAFDPDGRLLIGDGRTVQAIDPDTGAVLSTGTLLDQRKKDENAATPGTWASENLNVSPGDWHFDPAGDWYMMASDNDGASFGVDTSTVLWKIDPVTLCAIRVSNTDNPFGSGTGSSWFAPNQHLLSSGSGITVYNVPEDTAPGTDTAWDNAAIPDAPYVINDLASQWQEVEPIRIYGTRQQACDGDDCPEWEWCIVQQDATTGELVTRPFDLTIPGVFGKCEKIKSAFVDDPLDPTATGGASEGCADCHQPWMDGCSDAGPTKWRRSTTTAGVATVEYWFGTNAAPTTAPPSGFTPIACADIVVPEVTTEPVCDIDTGAALYRREQTNADSTITVTFFNETGDVPEPTNWVAGVCPPDPDSDTVVADQKWCVNGEPTIQRSTTVFSADPDGNPTSTETVVWFNADGTVPAPVAGVDDLYLGDCVPESTPLQSHHLIEGCIDDQDGNPISAYTLVDQTGAALFAPKPLTDLGFRAEGCC